MDIHLSIFLSYSEYSLGWASHNFNDQAEWLISTFCRTVDKGQQDTNSTDKIY